MLAMQLMHIGKTVKNTLEFYMKELSKLPFRKISKQIFRGSIHVMSAE